MEDQINLKCYRHKISTNPCDYSETLKIIQKSIKKKYIPAKVTVIFLTTHFTHFYPLNSYLISTVPLHGTYTIYPQFNAYIYRVSVNFLNKPRKLKSSLSLTLLIFILITLHRLRPCFYFKINFLFHNYLNIPDFVR